MTSPERDSSSTTQNSETAKPKAYFAHELAPGCLVYRALDIEEMLQVSPSDELPRHDDSCEAELTSHGYTPCRCDERLAFSPSSEGREEFKGTLCGHCGLPIHPADTVRHFGFYVAHQEYECRSLLRGQADTLRASLTEAQARATEAEAQIERTSTLLLNISDTLRSRGFGGRAPLDERVIAMAQEMDQRWRLLTEAQAERDAAQDQTADMQQFANEQEQRAIRAEAEIERLKVDRDSWRRCADTRESERLVAVAEIERLTTEHTSLDNAQCETEERLAEVPRVVPETKEPPRVVNLMEALRRSLESVQSSKDGAQ